VIDYRATAYRLASNYQVTVHTQTHPAHRPVITKHGLLHWFFRAPVHLYHWGLGPLFGHRVMLLKHIGRRTGLPRETVLEVVKYRPDGPEVLVANGFGPNSDWVRNIEANPEAEVIVGSEHFKASRRYLGLEEAAAVIQDYEHRNRFIAPIVRRGFSWLVGWPYHSTDADRRRLVEQLPLIAFRPLPDPPRPA
jgi:deazaflavin-dependent oxidoreductase (nitroreductase family)